MRILKANEADLKRLVQLMQELWPHASADELTQEVRLGLRSGNMHYFIAIDQTRKPLGFCQLSFRYDYVPGSLSSPTAYLEGLYVVKTARHQRIATQLVEHASAFAVSKGCVQLASDTELENFISQQFHEKSGFKEVERVVTYIKNLSHET